MFPQRQAESTQLRVSCKYCQKGWKIGSEILSVEMWPEQKVPWHWRGAEGQITTFWKKTTTFFGQKMTFFWKIPFIEISSGTKNISFTCFKIIIWEWNFDIANPFLYTSVYLPLVSMHWNTLHIKIILQPLLSFLIWMFLKNCNTQYK